MQTCLRSTGRYGPSPFLVSYYGGSGELAQGFCRAAAVNGAVYILGRRITNIAFNHNSDNGHRYTLELDDFPDPLLAPCLLFSSLHVPDHLRQRVAPILSEPSKPLLHAVVRGVVILDDVVSPPRDGEEESQMERSSDSLIMVFPAASVEGGSHTCAVHVLTVGPGTMCTPPGKSMFHLSSRSLGIAHYIINQGIVYLSMPLHDQERGPKELLEPYLKVILATKSPPYNPLFQMYYTQHFPACPQQGAPVNSNDENLWVVPVVPPDISHGVDFAAQVAEKAFWKVVSSVRGPDASLDVSNGFWVDSMQGVDEDSD